jgi:RNA-directed DNA polymerase
MDRHASSGLTTRPWHPINGAAGHCQVRSRPRRSGQAVPAGAWRQVTRWRSRLVHSFAARPCAVTRVTEHAGPKTPGVEHALWDTPEKKAPGVARLGPWRGDHPRPLPRLSRPKQNGPQRPRSMPTRADRARPVVSRPTLQPLADPSAEPHADGWRPQRRGAEAIDQGLQV